MAAVLYLAGHGRLAEHQRAGIPDLDGIQAKQPRSASGCPERGQDRRRVPSPFFERLAQCNSKPASEVPAQRECGQELGAADRAFRLGQRDERRDQAGMRMARGKVERVFEIQGMRQGAVRQGGELRRSAVPRAQDRTRSAPGARGDVDKGLRLLRQPACRDPDSDRSEQDPFRCMDRRLRHRRRIE